MSHKTCSTCRFFHDNIQCRRYPPLAGQGWPETDPTDSCGEWKPVEEVSRVFANIQKITDADVLRVIQSSLTHSGLFTEFAREIVRKHQVCRRTAEDRMKRMAANGVLIVTEDEGVRYVEIEDKADAAFTKAEASPEPAEAAVSKAQHTFTTTLLPIMREIADTAAKAKGYSELHRRCHKVGRGTFDRILKEGVSSGLIVKTPEGIYYLKP